LIQTTGQLLTLQVGKVSQDSRAQSPIGSASGGTEDFQIAQQAVAQVGLDQDGSGLCVSFYLVSILNRFIPQGTILNVSPDR